MNISKIFGGNWNLQPIEKVAAKQGENVNSAKLYQPQKYDAFAQHDRGLENGFGGPQYKNGVLIGKNFNMVM